MRKTREGWEETGRLSPIFLAATAPFPKSRASYFRFARFNTSALYYLRAWHRLYGLQWSDHACQGAKEIQERKVFGVFLQGHFKRFKKIKGSLVW